MKTYLYLENNGRRVRISKEEANKRYGEPYMLDVIEDAKRLYKHSLRPYTRYIVGREVLGIEFK